MQLLYEVVVRVKEGGKVTSFSDLDDDTAYAAGVQIAADVRQLIAAATRRRMLSLQARTQSDATPFSPSPPPLVFVHVVKLRTQTTETVPETGMASQLANLSNKLATRVSRWSAKRFSHNPDLIERAGKAISSTRTSEENLRMQLHVANVSSILYLLICGFCPGSFPSLGPFVFLSSLSD